MRRLLAVAVLAVGCGAAVVPEPQPESCATPGDRRCAAADAGVERCEWTPDGGPAWTLYPCGQCVVTYNCSTCPAVTDCQDWTAALPGQACLGTVRGGGELQVCTPRGPQTCLDGGWVSEPKPYRGPRCAGACVPDAVQWQGWTCAP